MKREAFAAYTTHDFDPLTFFCVRCGMACEVALDTDAECAGGDNVVAISHIRAERRLLDLVKATKG